MHTPLIKNRGNQLLPGILFPVLLILFFSQCTPKQSARLVDDARSFDGISIGMPLEKAIAQAKRKNIVEKRKNIYLEEKNQFNYFVLTKNGREKLSFNGGYEGGNRNNVFRIVLYDSSYKTKEGISPGMNFQTLRTKARLGPANFNYTDGLFIQSASFDGGYWMELDGEETDQLQLHPPVLNDLPGRLRIKAIILF